PVKRLSWFHSLWPWRSRIRVRVMSPLYPVGCGRSGAVTGSSVRENEGMSAPVGHPTRGTTGTNRLRRNDRWIAASEAFRRADDPLVIDLGYGASGVTAFELAQRLR